MKIHNYDMLVQSLLMDIRKREEVCFLFGSAISLPDTGIGMPSTDEMVDIIRNYLSKFDIDGLDEYIRENNELTNYQAAFEFLLAVCTQEDVKEILQLAVNRAKNSEGKWILPKTCLDFAKLVFSDALKVRDILTTNFDPFIEESLEAVNSDRHLDINRIVLTEDLSFDSSTSHNNVRINVIHLHGYFDSDTMHTPDQLTANRDEIIASLKRTLGHRKLYIIGYGGWDDIINQTLKEMVNEKKGKYNIRWAYFSDNEQEINKDNSAFFSALLPAQVLSRFHAYKGVNCRNIFEEVNRRAHGVNMNMIEDINVIEKVSSVKPDGVVPLISLSDIYNPPQKTNVIMLKEFPITFDPSHNRIRLREQEKAREYLRTDGSFTLVSGLGYGKFEFSASFLMDEDPEYTALHLDCSDIQNKNEVSDRFIRDIGLDFTTLVATRDTNKLTVIFFDNITEPNPEIIQYFNEIISILKDYEEGLKGIFFTNRELNLTNRTVELHPLNLADVNEYLCHHLSSQLTPDELEQITRISSGLPTKLDKLKEHFSITSVSHVLNTPREELYSESDLLIDSIPKRLLNFISELSKAESEENKRVYSLLQVLCVLECGEEPKNIMKQFSSHKFKLDDFLRLVNNGLTHSVEIAHLKNFRVNRIDPIIKDYVRSKIDKVTLKKIRLEAIKMVSGDIWFNHRVTISRTTQILLDNIDFQPGNAHLLIIDALKNPIDKKDLKIYYDAAISYAFFLERKCRYKEAISFVNEVLLYFSEEKNLSYYRLINYLTESMRMLDREKEAIDILEQTLSTYTPENRYYNRSLYESMSSGLLLAYSHCNKEKAFTMAKNIRKTSKKNTYRRFLSESIILEKKFYGTEKVEKLRRLEKKARNHNNITIANNISLDLAVLDPSSTQQYISTVLSSEKSNYTMVRATLKKIEVILSDANITHINSNDIRSLIACYKYLFIQRMDWLFNRCHVLLWKALLLESRFEELFDVLLSSSLVWRVAGSIDKEKTYNQEIIDALGVHAQNYPANIAYIHRRLSALSTIPELSSARISN
ncbi:SIR2 family protein [Arsenophonus sp. aPb]|uniref:SIR2 family protein n=1 Tax=Arsenophonus sp. aPb TaxID=3041619 RepID=UPI002469296A|nr:SIR2 family protein [Arsenophonus sp. aPb]WGL97177.1 SIR2 family protein [Arsenophonus sp. aPb]